MRSINKKHSTLKYNKIKKGTYIDYKVILACLSHKKRQGIADEVNLIALTGNKEQTNVRRNKFSMNSNFKGKISA
jgi:hypothetical protein